MGSRRQIENMLFKGAKAAEHGDPRAVTVADSSQSIHQSLSGKHDQTGRVIGSRPLADLLGRSGEVELICSHDPVLLDRAQSEDRLRRG